ncbi:MAG: DUF2520 domain-containing protein [Bacteroidota bacterium]
MKSIKKIVIIGAGSLATNLALALHNNGLQLIQIVNRTIMNATILAKRVNASFTNNLDEIEQNADLYIIAIADAGISEIIKSMNLIDKLVVHTAGTIEMEVLKSVSCNYGVFYPLQTFSKTDITAFDKIPVCIEANSPENARLLIELGEKLSKNVQSITSSQRKMLHISAVFSCNFSSYMHLIAHQLLTENQLPFDLLQPLILRTAEKVQILQPEDALTGPARRNDTAVMDEHLQLLSNHIEFQAIYKLISDYIVKHYHQS